MQILQQQKDVFQIVLDHLSQYDILRLQLVSKFFYNVVNYYIKITKFYAIEENDNLNEACKKNLIISIIKTNCIIDWNEGLASAYYMNYKHIINFLHKKGADEMNHVINGACKGNDIDLVKKIIKSEHAISYGTFSDACFNGNQKIINLLIKKFSNDWNENMWNVGFYSACRGNHYNIAKDIIMNVSKIDVALQYACFNQNMPLIKLIMKHRLFRDVVDFGLYGACESGNINIINLMIKYGATDFGGALNYACQNNNIDVIKYLIDLGCDDWDDGLDGASYGGHINLVNMMIKNGANNWDDSLFSSTSQGHYEISKLLIEKGANNLNECLILVCSENKFNIAKLLIESGANNLNDALKESCEFKCYKIINYLIDCGANNIDELLLLFASKNNAIDIVELLINKGANKLNDALKNACEKNNYKSINLLIKKGATECKYCNKSIQTHLTTNT